MIVYSFMQWYIEREPGEVNLAGKVKNFFLDAIDIYRLENNKKMKSAGSEVVGGPMGGLGPKGASNFINSS